MTDKQYYYCINPPSISPTLDINKSDRCYLYRAITQNNNIFALEWLNKWAKEALINASDRSLVLHQCTKYKNKELIDKLYEMDLVTRADHIKSIELIL